MIEVRVPEEIEDYKEKIIMGLSIRQLISVGIALLCGVPTFLILNKFINGDVATYATMLVVVPAFCVGFFKKDGYNFETFLKVRLYAFLSKPQRGYATNPEESELPIEAEKYRPLIQKWEKEKQEKAANEQNNEIDLKGVIISFVRNIKNSENKSKNRKTKKTARREYDLVEVTEKGIKRRRKEAARILKASAGKHRKKKSKKEKAA